MDFYLNNDSARERIALNGQKYVYENHNYLERAREIVEALKAVQT